MTDDTREPARCKWCCRYPDDHEGDRDCDDHEYDGESWDDTIERLTTERDAAISVVKNMADTLTKTGKQRDEARRVARVLALFQQRCQEALADGEESDAYDTAIAYPEDKT